VQVACEYAGRELAQEALEQTRNGVWVPVLVARKQINVSLCIIKSAMLHNHMRSNAPLLNISLRFLITAELPLNR
jgi:hypothetical protein